MPTGRKAKPVEQHRREGTRPDTPRPPTLVGGREAPSMPPGLPAEAKPIWQLVVDDLLDGRVLDKVDWPAVEEFAVMLARARQARKALEWEKREHAARLRRLAKADPEDRDADDGIDPNPHGWLTQAGQKGSAVQSVYLQIERESWKEARQVGETLGLSPSARARLGLSGTKGRGSGQSAARKGVPESPRAARAGLGVVQGGRS